MKARMTSPRAPSADFQLIVPVSTDWTTLGSGGGIETFLKLFAKAASERGLKVTLPCSGPREGSIGSVHFLPIMNHAKSERAFTRHLRRAVLHGVVKVAPGAVVLANEEHYAWAFRGVNVPVVLMSHGEIPKMLRMRHSALFVKAYRFFIERPAISLSRKVVVVNHELLEHYLSQYPQQDPSKFAEIPVGLDLEELAGRPRSDPWEKLSVPPSTNLLLFVGRLYPEKDPLLFIEACDILRERGHAIEALLIGDGILVDSVRRAAETRPWLHWVASMARSDVLDTMAVARVLVVCSRYESGPLVLLEAIGLGTPVVSSQVGRAGRLIKGNLGRVVKANPVSVAEGVREVLTWNREDIKLEAESAKHLIDFRDTMAGLVDLLQRV